MSDNININTPEIGPYTQLQPFRFWCQKVLPLVYDESLSYYELLCKVVDYLNKTMEDVDQMITDMGEFQTADRDFKTEMRDAYIEMGRKFDQLQIFVETYFDTLDVQTEINNKLDAMAAAGYFDELFGRVFGEDVTTTTQSVATAYISAWIAENILQETGYVIDKTLTIENAAADSAAVGERLNLLRSSINDLTFLLNWKIGDRSNGSYNNLDYRVCSDIIVAPFDMLLKTKDGYQLYAVRYNNDDSVAQQVSWRSAVTIKEGTRFSITIRRTPESTSTPADLFTFVANIYNERALCGDYEVFNRPNPAISNPTVRAYTKLIPGTTGRLSIRANGYDHYLEVYKLDGTQLSDTSWKSDSYDYSLNPQRNYKVTFRNADNSAVDLADMRVNVAIYGISSGLDDILLLNNDKIAEVQQTFTGRPTFTGATDHVLSFLWFSDIHKEEKQWNRAVQVANYYADKFKFAIHTGDYVGNDQSNYNDLYGDGMTYKIPLLNVVGNHDVYTVFAGRIKADKEDTRAIIMPDTSDWGVTWGSGLYPMNYYKDFATEKVRLIVLDLYYDTSEQETWLANLLTDARTNGYHVITAMHETSRPITDWSDNTFNSKDAEALTDGGLNHSSTPFDIIIKNFKDAGGIHIANICGHEHVDFMGHTMNGVLNIVIGSQHGYYSDASDSMRIDNTITNDLLNIVGINTKLGLIKIVRIGDNIDHYLRRRNVLCYDYINDEVIANW